MDLSSNVCSLCCSIESKRLLVPLLGRENGSQEEFVREFLGPCQVSGALACGRCQEMLTNCQEFRASCRRNLEKVKMIQEEGRGCHQMPDSTSVIVKIERESGELPDNCRELPSNSVLTESVHRWMESPDSRRSSAGTNLLSKSPDSRRSSAGTIDSGGKVEIREIEEEEKHHSDEGQLINVDVIKSEDVKHDEIKAKRREKAVQWRKSLYQVSSPSEAIRLNNYREANRVRNMRYRERKRTESDASDESWRSDRRLSDERIEPWRESTRKRTESDEKQGGERRLSGGERRLSDDKSTPWSHMRNRSGSDGSTGSWREDDDNSAPVNIDVTPDVSLVVEDEYMEEASKKEGRLLQEEERYSNNPSSTHLRSPLILPVQPITSLPSKVIVPTSSSSNLVLPAPTPLPILLRGVPGQGGGPCPDVLYLTPVSSSATSGQGVAKLAPSVGGIVSPALSLDPEERRRARNREASRRYREKARGDPGLLLKMREQQNKRQKKYYARLREKKYHNDISVSPEPKEPHFTFPPHMDWSPTEGGLAITPLDKGVDPVGPTLDHRRRSSFPTEGGLAITALEKGVDPVAPTFDHHKPSISIIKHEYKPARSGEENCSANF